MPLGDGKGPPEGTGPMTGRKRLAASCPSKKPEKASGWSLLGLIVVALLALGVWFVSHNTDD
ncbi:MAG: hypothetical protein BWY06_01809 [Candidatus Latescibacteria bacterium ADurb.Bin168]|nr:MAG: hypothetical protein BWY06_01809 [Candidatus Latescibacteria bacterium ADurb.Bin168]